MNFLKVCIILGLVLNTFCALRKKNHKIMMKSKQENMQQYADAICMAIIKYKEAEFTFSPKLDQLALNEAKEILNNDDFAEHNRFSQLSAQVPNDYFTEISLKVQMNMLPEVDDFAKIVLKAIKTQKSEFLQYKETHIGGAMIKGDNNEYIITIQMLKKPDYYSSCKDQLFFGEEKTEIQIKKFGVITTVVCDAKTVSDNIAGGWTRILDQNDESTSAFIQIDDLNLEYTEILWIAKAGYLMDLNKDWSKDWDFNGWMFGINMFRFDNEWYISEEKPVQDSTWKYEVKGDAVRGTGYAEIKDQLNYYKISEDIENIQTASMCLMRKNKLNDKFCSTKFVLKNLPEGKRITGISDVETQANANSDNIYKRYYEIYVR